MNPPDRKELAILGERAAAEYLESQNFRIVARNFRLRIGEIDLIAWDGPVLVFIEVKARRSDRFGWGGEAIDRRKQLRIARVAQAYLQRFPEPPACRFDAAIVEFSRAADDAPLVEHLMDAFRIGETW